MVVVAVAPQPEAVPPMGSDAPPSQPQATDLPEPQPIDFDAVFALHHRRMVRVAGLLCGDRDEAEDVVAEVFARTYRQWRKGGIDDVGAYLRRGVVNEVRSRWRKRGVRRRVDARRTRDLVLEAPGADAGVGEHQRLAAALAQLNERQRAAIVLRFYDDRSEAETAALLDMPVGTVKSTVSRGLARLAELLGDEREEDAR
jgi:RNA polymerase sigma-70 factor (sigma-E family)